jgi:hypothetical protein
MGISIKEIDLFFLSSIHCACVFVPSIEFYNQNTFFIISTIVAVVWKDDWI